MFKIPPFYPPSTVTINQTHSALILLDQIYPIAYREARVLIGYTDQSKFALKQAF